LIVVIYTLVSLG